MNSRKITALLVVAFTLLVIAGTKVSQLTRTTSIQSGSRFMVSTQDATSGRWFSRYIEADDLGTNISAWITGALGSNGFILNSNGNQFSGNPLSIKTGSTETNKVLYSSTISSRPLTIYGMQGQDADHLRVNDYLGNILFGIDENGALFGEGATDSPRLTSTSTSGYVWTATGTDGKGSWAAGGSPNAVTNNQNSWFIWISPTVTNSYFAQNRGLGYYTNTTDFGGLLQSIFNRGVDGISIRLAANPYYTSHYVVSNTVTITNWFVMEGEGNAATTVHSKSGMTTPMIQLGTAGNFVSGICRINRIRFEGEGTSAGSVGVHVVNVAEPIFEYCEWTGFLMAGLRISTLYNTAWAYADNCWFVQKGANAHGILFDAEPNASVIGQNHFSVKNCIFGNHTSGGTGITVSNRFPGLVIQNSHFRNYAGVAGEGIILRAGGDFIIQGNQFQNFALATWPIIFADRLAATNYASSVIGNKAWTDGSQGQELVYLGDFVQGVNFAGNEGGTGLSSAVAAAGNNGTWNNSDKYQFKYAAISRTNALTYLDSDGIMQPATLSGASLSAGTLTIAAQTNSSIARQTELTALSNAVVTLSSNNVRVAAGSGVSVASAGSGGVQTFTVTATGGSGGAGSLPANANQLSTNTTLTIIERASLTNVNVYGTGAVFSGHVTVGTNVTAQAFVGSGTGVPILKLQTMMTADNALAFSVRTNWTQSTTNFFEVTNVTDGQVLAAHSSSAGQVVWTNSTPSGGLSFLGDWWTTDVTNNTIGGTFFTNTMSSGRAIGGNADNRQAKNLPYAGYIRGVLAGADGAFTTGNVTYEVFTNGVSTGVKAVQSTTPTTNGTGNVYFPANTLLDIRFYATTNLSPSAARDPTAVLILQANP